MGDKLSHLRRHHPFNANARINSHAPRPDYSGRSLLNLGFAGRKSQTATRNSCYHLFAQNRRPRWLNARNEISFCRWQPCLSWQCRVLRLPRKYTKNISRRTLTAPKQPIPRRKPIRPVRIFLKALPKENTTPEPHTRAASSSRRTDAELACCRFAAKRRKLKPNQRNLASILGRQPATGRQQVKARTQGWVCHDYLYA